VRFGEIEIGQDLGLAVVDERGELWPFLAELVSKMAHHRARVVPRVVGQSVLGETGSDRRCWRFEPIWLSPETQRGEFVKTLDQSNRFLIVIEGSSDAAIIRHDFALLKPHLSDFFLFRGYE
jgi:hypothetical protein